jgi:hypothetical protein
VAITKREFLLSSLFGPAFVKRHPDTRRRTLEFMINEKLLALGASGSAGDPRVVANLAALEGDLATEELYRDDILSTVHVTEREIDGALDEQKATVTLRWLYAKDRDGVEAIERDLRSGVSFDSLFHRQLADSGTTRDDRMMTSTLFQLRRRNSAMAALAGNLPAGHPSNAVQGPDGFYVVQIDSLTFDVMATESRDAQARLDARRALTKMKADSLSDRYVRNKMLKANPVIQRRAFDILRAHVGARVLPGDRFEAFDLTRRFRERNEVVDYVHIDRYGSLVLVQLRGGGVTLREFLQWYRLREANLNFRKGSPQAFFLSLEDVVWRMVRDHLLTASAFKRGLEHRPSVVLQKRWWKDKLLYQTAMDSIRRTIGWTDSTLRAYLTEHPRAFRDTTGAVRPFQEVKDDVLREWYDLTLKSRVMRRLARLKSQFPVVIDEEVLRRIPLDVENDPRAIEVYTVKKGGTFPHPAFPTIDYFWQTWQ